MKKTASVCYKEQWMYWSLFPPAIIIIIIIFPLHVLSLSVVIFNAAYAHLLFTIFTTNPSDKSGIVSRCRRAFKLHYYKRQGRPFSQL